MLLDSINCFFFFFCSYVLSKVHCYCYSWKTFSHLFLLNSPRYTFIYTTNVKRSLDETDFQKTTCSCATVIQKPWAKYTATSTLNLTKARLGLYVVNITRDRKQSFESIISLKKIKVPIQCNGTLTQEKKIIKSKRRKKKSRTIILEYHCICRKWQFFLD